MSTGDLAWSEPQPVPDGTWHRTAVVPCTHRTCPDGTLVVNLVTATGGSAPTLVASIVAALPGLLDDALGYLVTAARADPRTVGLDDADAVVQDALGEISLVVDESDEWLVHVGESPFPAAEPYGIAVRMRGLRPVGLEVLEDAEEL